jgi:uncharacterized protein (TIGR03435 family)
MTRMNKHLPYLISIVFRFRVISVCPGFFRQSNFRLRLLLAGICIVTALLGFVNDLQLRAQSPPATIVPLPSFEVASIKPTHSEKFGFSIKGSPDGFTARGTTTRDLIAFAYHVRGFQLSSVPGWATSERYDIDARTGDLPANKSEELSHDQEDGKLRLMLQSLLAERFRLTVHKETRVLPIYELVIAKDGPKLEETKGGDSDGKRPEGVMRQGMMVMGPGSLSGQGLPMTSLITLLSRQLSRTILDKTGLTGRYDIALHWASDEGSMSPMPPGDAHAAPPQALESTGPSIFTALQEQLGLKLQSTKGPVETVVIDRVERPSEN